MRPLQVCAARDLPVTCRVQQLSRLLSARCTEFILEQSDAAEGSGSGNTEGSSATVEQEAVMLNHMRGELEEAGGKNGGILHSTSPLCI